MIVRHTDALTFRARVEPFLARAEAQNNLLLGLLDILDATSLMVELTDGDDVIGAALRTPPFNLVVSALDASLIDPLVEQLHDIELPGVVGPTAAAQQFAQTWSARRRLPMRRHHALRVFENRQLIGARSPVDGGALRVAMADELPLVVAWHRAFDRDVGASAPLPERHIAERLATGDVVLWQTDRAVSMAAISRRTPHGAAISHVYTPPQLRGRGYASACVAALTARIHDDQRTAFLFTDLANPTSNKIYQALGYRPVADFTEYHFR